MIYMLFQNDFLTFPDSQKAGPVFHSERGSYDDSQQPK
jgi:hypothetical protein